MTDAPTQHGHDDPDLQDDQIIGTAFKWSIIVVAGIGVVVVGAILLFGGGDEGGETIIDKDPIEVPVLETREEIPLVVFTDVTTDAGIDFVHVNGDAGDRMLPETMGGGNAFFDADNDGDQDLLLVNSRPWPWNGGGDDALPTSAFYRNDGSGSFTNDTTAVGLDVALYGMGVAVGDYDGDGLIDVYLTAVGGNRLFRNTGSAFEDVTSVAGVSGSDDDWSTGAGFFDADGDGDLDLFVCNYVKWSRDIDLAVDYTLVGIGRAYGPPANYEGSHCTLFRNDGDGAFTDVSESAGLHVVNSVTGRAVGKALALLPMDIDGDGDLDVLVANDTTRNFLFINDGGGVFEESGAKAGVAYDGMGSATGAMGMDAAWYRNSDDVAVSIGNFANETTSFFVRQAGSTQFSDDALVEGVGSPSRIVLTFGLFFFDYDLDGRLDFLQANGHLEREINTVQSSQHYRQPTQLYWNAGPDAPAAYSLVSPDTTGDLAAMRVGRGASYADIDGDGDLDALVTQTGGPPSLLRNDQNLGNHWLRVVLDHPAPNTGAIGASVELACGGERQRRVVSPTRSYLSQVELPVTFGLPAGTLAGDVSLTVTWPDGTPQAVRVPAMDTVIRVSRDE
ncbi:MAG: CRTAC1 family protein [Planctomycetota bacterium]|jgi:hypothetical protein